MEQALVGIISDTHSLLRPQVLPVFKGVGLILHAGDIGDPKVLEDLGAIAPVVAVRGNNDTGAWAKRIPETQIANVAGASIYILHDVKELDRDVIADFRVIVSGHSHRPLIDERDGVLFVNPGSAGPRRFKLPISVARLSINGSSVRAKLIELSI